MLTLPIKKKWFDMVRSGEKKEEYREDSAYYRARFEKLFDLSDAALANPALQKAARIMLRNGYGATDPAVVITCVLQRGQGRPEWGAEPGKPGFILRILAVEAA